MKKLLATLSIVALSPVPAMAQEESSGGASAGAGAAGGGIAVGGVALTTAGLVGLAVLAVAVAASDDDNSANGTPNTPST